MTARVLLAAASIVCLVPAGRAGRAADPPAAVVALQEHVRKIIDAAEPSVVALVISHNPAYPEVPAADRARGVLGGYMAKGGEMLRLERDRLDLSNPKNVPDNHYGTGVVVDESGLILTNYHLVENATKIYVRGSDGKGGYADVHAADARSDLAVLKLVPRVFDGRPALKAVKFADVRMADEVGPGAKKANVYRGMWVVSVAHPFAAGFADGSPSGSWGMLSNVRRRMPAYGGEEHVQGHLYSYGSLLQTDARLNLGCSGGILLNLDGDMIGLTSSIAAVAGSESAGGFAVPMTPNYQRIIDVLKSGREVEYGFLGVSPGEMDGTRGLRISNVTQNTPAGTAGLEAQEVIRAINGVPVRDPDDLFLNVGAALAGTELTLTVSGSAGRPRDAKLVLAKFRHSYPFIASARPDAVHGLRVEYSSIMLQQNIGGRGLPNGLSHAGVVVREIDPKSPAEARFREAGNDPLKWIITRVNGDAVNTPDEFYRAAGKKRSVRLTIANPTDALDRGREIVLP